MSGQPIPVNIITGFLGAGKTTTILALLTDRPPRERWAVLVNEFGKVPIDQTALRALGGDGLQVAEVAGGCLCCTAGLDLQRSLLKLVQATTPDRVLIEPTGLGHPAHIRRILGEPPLRDLVTPTATVCLLDPRQFANPRFEHILSYGEQVRIADVLVLNKTDLADSDTLASCRRRLRDDFPDKGHVVETQQGRIALTWLDVSAVEAIGDVSPSPPPPARHDHDSAPKESLRDGVRRLESADLDRHGCGWILEPIMSFSHENLSAFLSSLGTDPTISDHPDILRVKGVLHTDRGWWLYNAVGGETTWNPIAPSPDNRLEIIGGRTAPNWRALEKRLLACLHDPIDASG